MHVYIACTDNLHDHEMCDCYTYPVATYQLDYYFNYLFIDTVIKIFDFYFALPSKDRLPVV